MRIRATGIVGLAASVLALGATAASAAGGPPPPKSPTGKKVEVVATGLQTTTAFAFGAGQTFVAEVPSGPTGGGVYVIKHGTPTLLTEGPPVAFGLAWHNQALYVSAGNRLVVMSHWNGSHFQRVRVIYTAPDGFTGFNGIGFGANGRLYAGVSLGETNDHSPSSAPYAFDVLSFKANGTDLKVVATGLRQPWQMAFPRGSSSPFVTDLGQDGPAGIKAPDFLVRIKPGQAYGFPSCNWVSLKPCKGYTKPVRFFSPHSDPMGLAIADGRLYISEFGPAAPMLPKVVSMPLRGGPLKTVLRGFAAPIVGLAAHGGWLYVGDVAGDVYRVKL
jgi:glucose/arabinose dehydrogenase